MQIKSELNNGMKSIKIIILFVVVGLCSCQERAKEEQTENKDTLSTMKLATDSNVISAAIDSSHSSKNSLDWAGSYKGVLPCDDCEGLDIVITLAKDDTYKMSAKKLGKAGSGNNALGGPFKWVDGSVIELEGLNGEPTKFSVGENKLVQLDKDGKPFEGAPARKYTLTKIK